MNVSVPTGNRRLSQEEHMIAFVGPSLSTVPVTDTVDDRELCTVLGIKLGSKIGTVLDREPIQLISNLIQLKSISIFVPKWEHYLE
jgi:hypothetical protein